MYVANCRTLPTSLNGAAALCRADLRYTQAMTSSNCYYGKIDNDVWFQPDW